MRQCLFIALLLCCLQSEAQDKQAYWSIGVNPLGLLEPMPVLGPCVSYRLSPRLEVWAEASYLFSLYNIKGWKNLQGYRFILQPRYYLGRKRMFFIAPEFRLKHYTYQSSGGFINTTTHDTLNNYSYKASQVLSGGALVAGGQVVLSKRRQLYLEITAGIGNKRRSVTKTGVPAGYEMADSRGGSGFSIQYEREGNVPYFPLGLRLIWKLNR